MKNSKLLNNVTGHSVACSEFLDVLNAVLAYAKTFQQTYEVSFDDAGMNDIYEDLDPANFLPSTSKSTYARFICAARLCRLCEDLLPLVERLNSSPPPTSNRTTVKLALRLLSDSQLQKLHTRELMFCVEGCCNAMNQRTTGRGTPDLSPAVFYVFAINMSTWCPIKETSFSPSMIVAPACPHYSVRLSNQESINPRPFAISS